MNPLEHQSSLLTWADSFQEVLLPRFEDGMTALLTCKALKLVEIIQQ